MDSSKLIKFINSVLKSKWSRKDVKNGKDILILPAWKDPAKEIISKYKRKGWVVSRKVSISSRGRQIFLNFKHPDWN